jgi:uncharacterized DUF497 family protein
MKIEFDPAKNALNIAKHDISFEDVVYFDFDTALIDQDDRKLYGEIRLVALGYLFDRIHSLCFTKVDQGIRIISLRKANRREVRYYEQETANR